MHPSKQAHNFGSYFIGTDKDFADTHGVCCLSPSWWAFIIRLNVDTEDEENTIDNLFCEHCRRMICLEDDMPAWK